MSRWVKGFDGSCSVGALSQSTLTTGFVTSVTHCRRSSRRVCATHCFGTHCALVVEAPASARLGVGAGFGAERGQARQCCERSEERERAEVGLLGAKRMRASAVCEGARGGASGRRHLRLSYAR